MVNIHHLYGGTSRNANHMPFTNVGASPLS